MGLTTAVHKNVATVWTEIFFLRVTTVLVLGLEVQKTFSIEDLEIARHSKNPSYDKIAPELAVAHVEYHVAATVFPAATSTMPW